MGKEVRPESPVLDPPPESMGSWMLQTSITLGEFKKAITDLEKTQKDQGGSLTELVTQKIRGVHARIQRVELGVQQTNVLIAKKCDDCPGSEAMKGLERLEDLRERNHKDQITRMQADIDSAKADKKWYQDSRTQKRVLFWTAVGVVVAVISVIVLVWRW